MDKKQAISDRLAKNLPTKHKKTNQDYIDKKDINLVSKILKSELITQGDYVAKFEKALNKKFGSMHCCAVSSGTNANERSYSGMSV